MDNTNTIKKRIPKSEVCCRINKFRTQTAHMTGIFVLLICLFSQSTRNGIIWSFIFTVYYFVLAFIAKKTFDLKSKLFYEVGSYEANKHLFKLFYIILCLIIFIIGSILTGFFIALVITFMIWAVTFIYYLFDADGKICTIYENEVFNDGKFPNKFSKLRDFKNRYPIVYEGLYYLSLLAIIMIPTLYLPVISWIKIAIIATYIVSIPIISLTAEKGADITNIFDFEDF